MGRIGWVMLTKGLKLAFDYNYDVAGNLTDDFQGS
jgi:hypothetical protein